jgi:hypothetical protein
MMIKFVAIAQKHVTYDYMLSWVIVAKCPNYKPCFVVMNG